MYDVLSSSAVIDGILVSLKRNFKVGQVVYCSYFKISGIIIDVNKQLNMVLINTKKGVIHVNLKGEWLKGRILYRILNNNYKFSYFHNMKIGQEVFCLTDGYGEITYIPSILGFIEVCFDNKNRCNFYRNGESPITNRRIYKVLNK